jgi:bidirectional [NiFe] hydrogenase diaphorase subunit
MGTACYVKGAEHIQTALEEHHQCKFGQTTKDNKVSFITARCVGSCGLAPVAVLDDAVVGKLNPEESIKRVEQLKNTPREVLA